MLTIRVVQIEARKRRGESGQNALQSLGADVWQRECLEGVAEPDSFHGCVQGESRVGDGQVAFHFIFDNASVNLQLPLVDAPGAGEAEAYAVVPQQIVRMAWGGYPAQVLRRSDDGHGERAG